MRTVTYTKPWDVTNKPYGCRPKPSNACGLWTYGGVMYRHRECRHMPLTICKRDWR